MIWTCKICGQGYDDMFCGDYICDDCFDKMKMEEKKQKQRNTPFFRILSLALAISLMLCIFSNFGVAHAVNITDSPYGEHTPYTYKEYAAFKWTMGSTISLAQLYNFHKQNYSDYSQLYYYLLYWDENGDIHFYNNAISSYYFTSTVLADVDVSSSSARALTCSNLNGNYYVGTALSDSQKKANCMTYHLNNVLNSQSVNVPVVQYSYSGYPDINPVVCKYVVWDNTNTDMACFNSATDYYLVPVPYDKDNGLTDEYYKQLLINEGSQSDLVTKVDPTFTAKFHSFSSLNDGETGLNMIDWLGMGKQYPIVDFSINDNGNNHSYSLRISANDKYVDTCMNLWQDYKENNLTSIAGNVIGAFAAVNTLLSGVGSTVYGPLGLLLITVPSQTNTSEALLKIAQYKLLENLDDLSYVQQYNLTNQYLQFNEGESSSRAYSVCLVDYLTVVKGLVYRLDIVDNNTGLILDTAFFSNDTTFAVTQTGYGCKVNYYSDYDNLLGDIDTDNNYANSDNFIEGDGLHSDNPNDIVDWDKYNQYDFTNIQNLTGTLNSATAGLGGFFMACYNIIPPVFVSILLGTFTLVIILRVLGR